VVHVQRRVPGAGRPHALGIGGLREARRAPLAWLVVPVSPRPWTPIELPLYAPDPYEDGLEPEEDEDADDSEDE